MSSPSNGDASHKRKESPTSSEAKSAKKPKRLGPRADSKSGETANGAGEKDGDGSSKPKRVRTGCLTCRERHLKCDEALPECHNCKKGHRICKRGVRLNFIDIWTEAPPRILSHYGTQNWKVDFLDESREIAGEYQGGLQRYKHLNHEVEIPTYTVEASRHVNYDFEPATAPDPSVIQQMPLAHDPLLEQYSDLHRISTATEAYVAQPKPEANQYQALQAPPSASTQSSHLTEPGYKAAPTASWASFNSLDDELPDPELVKKEYLDNQEETLYMQVFVEEVGLWMDSMDPQKHFSRLLPFHSLSEPMLLNAFLACGARHLGLVNPAYKEEKAMHYYDTATRYLLKNLQNPNRDTVVCATTAVILNVYEIMSERAMQRMNHIAGARALIKECGWNARAHGIGSACFWLNIGLEVMSCLHFNWQVAWDPDEWGVDMDFSRELHNGREEIWTHRMLYIIGRICNFRATTPKQQEADSGDEQIRRQQRHEQWTRLKAMCDAWNEGIPRTMHPMAYLFPYQTSSKSAFPEVWLVKRSTIVARLFFHTAMLLLAQTHPYWSTDHPEMGELQSRHSQMICGITAHVKDRGVASVAIRALAHAAEVLTDRKEQEEVLEIFEKINKETGWRIGYVYKELMVRWGWNKEPSLRQFAQTHTAARQAKEAQEAAKHHHHQLRSMRPHQSFDATSPQQNVPNISSSSSQSQQQQPNPLTSPQQTQSPQRRPPSGIPNPMYAKADFNLPQHPYQNYYVAPTNGYGNPQGGHHLYYSL